MGSIPRPFRRILAVLISLLGFGLPWQWLAIAVQVCLLMLGWNDTDHRQMQSMQQLLLAREMKLLKLGTIALDGTKHNANANTKN